MQSCKICYNDLSWPDHQHVWFTIMGGPIPKGQGLYSPIFLDTKNIYKPTVCLIRTTFLRLTDHKDGVTCTTIYGGGARGPMLGG